MNIIKLYERFPTQADCRAHIEKARWGDTPKCPYCASLRVTPVPKESRYRCNNCKTSFSATVGTIFHKSKIDLQRWFFAIDLVLTARKGISARQLARDVEVNKSTGWLMLTRVRKAMADGDSLLHEVVKGWTHIMTDEDSAGCVQNARIKSNSSNKLSYI